MNILKLQEEIDGTNYWDAYALDFRASFFGDECRLYIEVENGKSDQYCWRLFSTVVLMLNMRRMLVGLVGKVRLVQEISI